MTRPPPYGGNVVRIGRVEPWLLDVVMRLRPGEVGGVRAWAVLALIVARCVGHGDGFTWTIDRIAAHHGCCRRMIQRSLGELRARGLIDARRRASRRGAPVTYDPDPVSIRRFLDQQERFLSSQEVLCDE